MLTGVLAAFPSRVRNSRVLTPVLATAKTISGKFFELFLSEILELNKIAHIMNNGVMAIGGAEDGNGPSIPKVPRY